MFEQREPIRLPLMLRCTGCGKGIKIANVDIPRASTRLTAAGWSVRSRDRRMFCKRCTEIKVGVPSA